MTEITKELIAAALISTFIFAESLKRIKKSIQMMRYGKSGSIFISDISVFDAINVAI